MKPRARLVGQSALQAYQSDVPAGGTTPTAEDQDAILVATLLRHSLIDRDAPASQRIRDEAVGIARGSLGEAMLSRGGTYDDRPATSPTDVVRLLAQRTEHAGRQHLAQHLLESLAAIEEDPIAQGRVLADRARVSRKLGFLDLSLEQTQELLRMGRRLQCPELVAQAHLLAGGVAETRGNRVEFRVRTMRGLRTAKAAGLRSLEASGHAGLGTAFAMIGRYGDAVEHYWRAHQLVEGRGHVARAALGNLAQTLLVSGRPAEARKVATLVLQEKAPLIVTLPMLGCFAIASASVGDREAVRWACGQVKQLAQSRHHARETAEALVECAAALEVIDEMVEARELRRRGEEIAAHFGFHDLTFQEAIGFARGKQPRLPFSGAAEGAAAEIIEIDVPRIPLDAEVHLT